MATVVFKTRSSSRYLATRTVCLPVPLVENLAKADLVDIEIIAKEGYTIHIAVDAPQITQYAVKKTAANDNEFYVYKY